MVKDGGLVNGLGEKGKEMVNGTKREDSGGGGKETVRCVIATGSVDLNVRVFAS